MVWYGYGMVWYGMVWYGMVEQPIANNQLDKYICIYI